MVGGWGNPFDQHNMSNRLKERATSGELEFILTTDFQMTTSCLWSDVVLPAPSWYEKHDLTATILHPYLQLQQPAIKPLFESRSELWIFRELAKRLNPEFEKHFFPELDENEAALKVIEMLLANGGIETAGHHPGDAAEGTGPSAFAGPRRSPGALLRTGRSTANPSRRSAIRRRSRPPAQFLRSGRIEFYKDEDLFLSEGEQLPVHKETYAETEYKVNPAARDKYRLRYRHQELAVPGPFHPLQQQHPPRAAGQQGQGLSQPQAMPASAASRTAIWCRSTTIAARPGPMPSSIPAAAPARRSSRRGGGPAISAEESYNSLTYPVDQTAA